jgi:hypothetical protein
MVRIRIIDDEPKWINFLTTILSDYEIVDSEADLYIVNSRKLDRIVPTKSIVFTAKYEDREEISAYLKGALDYKVKDFRRTVTLGIIKNAIYKLNIT